MTDALVLGLEALIRQVDHRGSAALEKDDRVARFTKGGSPHELRIQYVPLYSWILIYRVELPGAKSRWFVESKFVWFPEKSGCKRLSLAPLDGKYKLFASDEAFFREVFGDKKLVDLLMPLDLTHLKENLRDGALTARWSVRFNPRVPGREEFLLNAATVLLNHGLDCFVSVQRARASRGEIPSFTL